jgi:hypothetical protein
MNIGRSCRKRSNALPPATWSNGLHLKAQVSQQCERDTLAPDLAPCFPRMTAKNSNAVNGALPLLKSPVSSAPIPCSLHYRTPSMRSMRRGRGVSRCCSKGSALLLLQGFCLALLLIELYFRADRAAAFSSRRFANF